MRSHTLGTDARLLALLCLTACGEGLTALPVLSPGPEVTEVFSTAPWHSGHAPRAGMGFTSTAFVHRVGDDHIVGVPAAGGSTRFIERDEEIDCE